MYRLEPYAIKSDAVPAQIIYSLHSYHQNDVSTIVDGVSMLNLSGDASTSGRSNETSFLEQQRLIVDRLMQLEKNIKEYNAQNAKKASNKSTGKKVAPVQRQQQKSQPSSLVVSAKTVHARLPVTMKVFPVHDYGSDIAQQQYANEKFTLQCSKLDTPWVELFSRLGRKRNVYFAQETKASTKTTYIQVKVDSTHSGVCLKGPLEVNGRVEVWKFLGTLLGLYSTEDTIVTREANAWLSSAEKLTKINDGFSRELCRYLSPNDFLSGCNAVSLADVVVRSLFNNNATLINWKDINAANNVQIWVKRVDESLARFL